MKKYFPRTIVTIIALSFGLILYGIILPSIMPLHIQLAESEIQSGWLQALGWGASILIMVVLAAQWMSRTAKIIGWCSMCLLLALLVS